MKRIVSLLLITLLVLHAGLLNAGLAHAQTGEELVKIDSLQVSPGKVNGGEMVTFSLKTSDENVKDIILSYINEEQQNKEINLQHTNNGWNGEYKTSVADSGKWSLSTITATSENGYKTILPASALTDQSAVDFVVGETQTTIKQSVSAELTQPTQVSFDKDFVNAGENLTIHVSTADQDLTEVYVQLKGPSDDWLSYEDLFLEKDENGQWSKTFTLSENEEPGEWKVEHIRLRAGDQSQEFNYSIDNYPAEFGKYEVDNPHYDTEAPVLTGVNFEKTSLAIGEKTKVTMTAQDQSGISFAMMSLTGPNEEHHSVYFEIGEDGVLTGELNDSGEMVQGQWKVTYISMEDLYGKTQNYFSESDFPVEIPAIQIGDGGAEEEAPTVTAVEFEKSDMKPGDTANVYVQVSDYTKINNLTLKIMSPSGNQTLEVTFYDLESNHLKQAITLPEDAELGEWRVESANIFTNEEELWTYYTLENYPSSFQKLNVTTDTDNDNEPPVLSNIEFSEETVNAGETLDVFVTAEDNLSGIGWISLYFSNGDGKGLSIHAFEKQSDGRWKGSIAISEYAKNETWYVESVSASDQNNNEFWKSYDLEDNPFPTFTIYNENEDDTPPIVKGVSFGKESVPAGESNTINVAVEDSSEVNSVIVYLISETKNNYKSLFLDKNEAGQWTADFEVDLFTEPGTWEIESIYVRDAADNSENYYYSDEYYPEYLSSFAVINEGYDNQPPTIVSVDFEKETMNVDEHNMVNLTVEDSSGVEFASLSLISPAGNTESYVYFPNYETNKLSESFSLPYYSEPGEWRVGQISVRDRNGNDKTYFYNEDNYPELFERLHVTNDQFDEQAPTVSHIEFSKDTFVPGETVEVFVSADDNKSGVNSIDINLTDYNGQYLWVNNFEQQFDGRWKGTVTIPLTTKSSQFHLSGISVYDGVWNEFYAYYNEFDINPYPSFNVFNENEDNDSPVVKEVSFAKDTVQPGENNTVYVTVEDASPVESVEIQLVNASNNTYIYVETTLVDNQWKGEFDITNSTRPGEWLVSSIYVRDTANNYSSNYYYKHDHPNNIGLFNVINENFDNDPPTAVAVDFDKDTLKPGEMVNIQLEAEDLSGIQYAAIGLAGPNNKNNEYVELSNEDLSGSFTVPTNAEPGKWRVRYITLFDTNNNEITIDYTEDQYPETFDTFSVDNENYDNVPPTLLDIELSKSEVNAGDSLEVYVTAEDQSGINSVNVEFSNGEMSLYVNEFTEQTDGRLKGTVNIPAYYKNAEWYVSSLYVYDKNYNEFSKNYEKNNNPFSKFTVINDNPDVIAPVISEVYFEKENIEVSDYNTIYVKMTDDFSGVDYADIQLTSPSGNQHKFVYVWEEVNEGVYKGTFKLNEYAEPGVWKISEIRAKDHNGNETTTTYNPGQYPEHLGSFILTNNNFDSEAPVVTNVQFGTDLVTAGNSVEIRVEATDNLSGISYITVGLENEAGNMKFISGFTNQDGKWISNWETSSYLQPGEYKVKYLYVSDNAGNAFEKNYDKENPAGFDTITVENEHPDITAPVIESISFTKSVLQAGETGYAKIVANDDLSGVSHLGISFKSPSGQVLHVYNEITKQLDGSWLAEFQVSPFAEPGEWKVNYAYVSDVNDNTRYYESEGIFASTFDTFTVENENPDVTIPEIKSVSFEQESYQAGDVLKVTSVIEDDQSGVKDAGLHLKSPDDSEWIYVELTNNEGNLYYGSVQLPDSVQPGEWKVGSSFVRDQATNRGNHDYYETYPDTFGKFQVVNDHYVQKPNVNTFNENSTELSGEALPGHEIRIYDFHENVIGTGTANEEGKFSITIPKQAAGTELKVTATNSEGNTSNPRYVYVEHVSIMEPPVVYPFSDQDTILSGTAEANTSVSVFIEEKYYYADVNENGGFSVEIGKQKAGTMIEAVAEDKEGNRISEAVKITVQDKTAPDKPEVNEVDEIDTTVTGLAEAGSMVTVKAESTLLGTARASENGAFSVAIVNQKAGTKLTVTSMDSEGNVSEAAEVTVVDTTAPEKPFLNEVGDSDVQVTGTAEAGSSVTVNTGTTTLGTAIASDNGTFIVLIEKQKAGTKLSVTATDIFGNKSEKSEITVADKTAPNKPVVNEVGDSDVKVTGTAEAGSTVTVKAGTTTLGTATASETGVFSVEIAMQKAGVKLSVTALDVSNNESEETGVTVIDKTAPLKPVVNAVDDNDVIVTGKAEAGSTVTVKAGTTTLGAGAVSDTGSFSVTIAKQAAGVKLTITAQDAAGNVGEETEVTVADKTAPPAPTVNTVDDNDLKVTGKAEAGSTVTVKYGTTTLGTATATSTGTFSVTIVKQKAGTKLSVTATDAAKNTSSATAKIVIDKTAPTAPTVNTVDDNDLKVTGKAEAGSTVTVKSGTTTLGTATATSTGTFSVTIVKQKAGTKLSVTAKDKAKNTSSATAKTVIDKTAPAAPTVNTVDDNDLKVTGKAEAGSTVIVKVGTLTLGTATATSTGTFSVTIVKQKAGTKLSVTATDTAKNTSSATTKTVIDKTAPAAPTVNTVDDNDLKVTGKAEAGSTIAVKVGSTTLGTATTTSTGTFSVTIVKQKAGTKLSVTATDKAKNTSTVRSVTVIDKTAPAAPTVNTVDDNDLKVTGKAEAGSTVTVKVGTTTLGTATTISTGTFSVTIVKQKAGTKLTVTATDKAKNKSTATTKTVIDKTAPNAPTINKVDNNDLKVTGKAEAGSTVIVKVGTKTLGSAKALSNGTYTIKIAAQKTGTKLTVTATDTAKNVSKGTVITVVKA